VGLDHSQVAACAVEVAFLATFVAQKIVQARESLGLGFRVTALAEKNTSQLDVNNAEVHMIGRVSW
jgi:hypothetical protein